MTPRQILYTTAFTLAAAVGALTAGSAMADPFDACTDHNWDAFVAAADSGEASVLESFLEVVGPDCPLGDTATVLLCQLNPAACLQVIQPAAGRPQIEVILPERENLIITTAPGSHIGIERDGGDNRPGNDNPGNDNPGTDNPGNDNPGNDNPGNDGPDKADAEPGATITAN